MALLIKGGRVVDPASNRDGVGDVVVGDGRVENTIDARGLIVTPGWIDLHVHLREPGHEHKETIATATAAALAGGFTSIVAMANSGQVIDSVPLVRYVKSRAVECGYPNVYPVAAVTRGLEGKQLVDMHALAEAGAVAFSDDGHWVDDYGLMRRALEYAPRPILTHAEDKGVSRGGVMNEGALSVKLGLQGQPAEGEELAVARDIALARRTGAALHVQHVSTARAVKLIADAKREGLRVTAEATPHHLALTEAAWENFDSSAKMNPPLRTEADRRALLAGVADGTIDAIATDHAPHSVEEKQQDLMNAPFGIVGLETAGAVLFDRGEIPVPALVRALTLGAARVIGVEKGRIADGDVTLFDPNEAWTVDPAKFMTKGRSTPWAGRRLKGRVKHVILGGRLCF